MVRNIYPDTEKFIKPSLILNLKRCVSIQAEQKEEWMIYYRDSGWLVHVSEVKNWTRPAS